MIWKIATICLLYTTVVATLIAVYQYQRAEMYRERFERIKTAPIGTLISGMAIPWLMKVLED